MNKPLKFSSRTHKLLWCSDFHLGHTPTWSPAPFETRGFKSIGEHDEWVKDQWFKHVDDSTIVFQLGDTTFKDPKGEMFRQLTQWPGTVYHVWGNHRSGATQIYHEGVGNLLSDWGCGRSGAGLPLPTIYPVTVGNTTFVGDSLHAWIDGLSVFMTHYAWYIWPEMGNDGGAVCGHSHSSCAELNPDGKTQGRVLDVGIDNAIKTNGTAFFTWDEVKRILNAKGKVVKDHHNGSVAGQ